MSDVIVYLEAGVTKIVRPVGLSASQLISTIPSGCPSKVVDSSDLPADRTFREAWDYTTLAVDMVRARNVWRDHLRALRIPVLEALDVKFLRAVESGDVVTQSQVAARKQLLRDLPELPDIASAATPTELKAVMPVCITDPV